MVNPMVERATSDMLIGPDWAMNIEICDMCNHDPGQAKDVVKGIKKRLGSRNSKVQLLALTLLETIIKNCGDIVHMQVAEKGLLHDMVKIARKKPDLHVKEKILTLIDTWQEAFGGPRARYPQYYAAYQELLRAGAVFPQRTEQSAPVLTPPQTQPLTSYTQKLRNPELRPEAAESSESEFPTLSLSEIQNARGLMDVLSEMLSALDPGNKEGLRQEVIVDLVEQCRTYKQRVVHLVNSTADESLLCQGLALNDDLQRVLAKHEAIASGTAPPKDKPKTNAQPSGSLVDVDGPLVDVGHASKQPNRESPSSSGAANQPFNQLVLTAPPTGNGPATPSAANPRMDLLSGDDFSSPKSDTSLALVPVGETQPAGSPSQQNALVLFDMFSDNQPNGVNNPPNAANVQQPTHLDGQNNPMTQQYQQQQQQNFQSPDSGMYPNGTTPNSGSPRYEQSPFMQAAVPAWNGQLVQQQQQPASPVYGSQSGGSLPPPPWEAQAAADGLGSPVGGSQYPSQPMAVTQVVVTHSQPLASAMNPMGGMGNDPGVGIYIQPGSNGLPMSPMGNQGAGQVNPYFGMQQQPQGGGQYMGMGMGMVPQQMQGGGGGYMNPSMYPQYQQQQQQQAMMYNQMQAGKYGGGGGGMYGQQQPQQLTPQQQRYLEQKMYAMSMRDDSSMRSSNTAGGYGMSSNSQSLVPSAKPAKPEDKLFGDLVDLTKFKPGKT
ncbi:TOM1-like protein 9 [Linum perenne]